MLEALVVVPAPPEVEVRFDDCRRLALAVIAQVLIDGQESAEAAAQEAAAVERGALDHWLEVAFDDPSAARARLVALLHDPTRLASISVSAAGLAADRAPTPPVRPEVTPGIIVTPGGPVTPSTLTFYLWLCRGDPKALAKAIGVAPRRVKAALVAASIDPAACGEDAPEPSGPWTQTDLINLILDSDGDLARVGRRLGAPKLIITAALRRWSWLAAGQLWGSVRLSAIEEMKQWRLTNV